ncbi:MAG: hypothetical protein SNG35_02180 [Rikenellaceae bacterium]
MTTDESRKRDVVEQLNQHVDRLIARYNAAKERNKEIEKMLTDEQEQRRRLQKRVDELQRELTYAQIATTLTGEEQDEGSKRARNYISRLLREVDECIALVSTPLERGLNREPDRELDR